VAEFGVTAGSFGHRETVEIFNEEAGQRVVIATQGATLLQWQNRVSGRRRDLIDGYATPEEFNAQAGVRSGIMAPFSNRVRYGRYEFGGRQHQLAPAAPGEDLVFHGFLRMIDLAVVDASTTAGGATVVLETKAIRPGAFDGYPFAIDVQVVFDVGPLGIGLHITAENVGDETAPWACGWHPYFRLSSAGIEDLELQVPARTVVRTDAGLLPLDGSAAWAQLDELPELDHRTPRPIRGRELDTAYAGLLVGVDRLSRTTVTNPADGAALNVWQQRGLMHAYTGEGLQRARRKSIALEPIEMMTNAFNRPEAAAEVSLPPGASRSFKCGVDLIDAR
jgi:aldose 1-epimerase